MNQIAADREWKEALGDDKLSITCSHIIKSYLTGCIAILWWIKKNNVQKVSYNSKCIYL